jgi:hypothetical protein
MLRQRDRGDFRCSKQPHVPAAASLSRLARAFVRTVACLRRYLPRAYLRNWLRTRPRRWRRRLRRQWAITRPQSSCHRRPLRLPCVPTRRRSAIPTLRNIRHRLRPKLPGHPLSASIMGQGQALGRQEAILHRPRRRRRLCHRPLRRAMPLVRLRSSHRAVVWLPGRSLRSEAAGVWC